MTARVVRWGRAQWPRALGALLLVCAALPLAAGRARVVEPPPAAAGARPEGPLEWRGQALHPLARSAVEARFAERFAGRIARFGIAGSGEQLVLREVDRPTRMLHPAVDCWRGIGWDIGSAALVDDPADGLWRCFEATQRGERVRVCERIVDAQGRVFTDTSAWYWAASLARSHGPWRALTRVQPLAPL